MSGSIHGERRGDVAWLTLSNPSKRNALDPAMCAALAQAVQALAADGVRAAVLAGDPAGGAFSAGFDLEALGEGGAVAAEGHVDALMDALSRSPVPLVAAVGGAAMGGGCELAATCDLRVGHAQARFGLPPARLGLVYAARGLARFSAIVGESRARRLFLSAHTIDGATAHTWGLLDELVDPDAVLTRAGALADELAALAPLAVQGMRATFEALVRRRAALEGQEATDVGAWRQVAARSADAREGLAAVRQRRAPRFTGG